MRINSNYKKESYINKKDGAFDCLMSALPIIVKQKSLCAGLFTHQQGTWAGFRPSWDVFHADR